MKMNFILILSFLSLGLFKASAQTFYVDPAVSAATAAHASVINTQLNITRDKLTLVERGQLAVTGQLGAVNSMQEKIYKGLSQVNSILTNLSDVQEISRLTLGMTDDINKGLAIARKNPAFLVFAEEQANFFYQRATKLALEVSNFALKGGSDNLMDSGERGKMISHILTEVLILRSLTYGMYRAMNYAQMRGLWRSLNPFQGYVDINDQILNDIMQRRKYIK
uniref:hypothetical protein n=1 Tax=Pedobacter sp. TaxID=1411316 RepID=UPI00159ABBA8|nr:hypothetical protein [Pedobacter sp.]QJS06242.1 hypothetical protein [Pedobacter sp.]